MGGPFFALFPALVSTGQNVFYFFENYVSPKLDRLSLIDMKKEMAGIGRPNIFGGGEPPALFDFCAQKGAPFQGRPVKNLLN